MATVIRYFETAFTEGFLVPHIRTQEEVKWKDWYNSNYASLFQEKSIDNGLAAYERCLLYTSPSPRD